MTDILVTIGVKAITLVSLLMALCVVLLFWTSAVVAVFFVAGWVLDTFQRIWS